MILARLVSLILFAVIGVQAQASHCEIDLSFSLTEVESTYGWILKGSDGVGRIAVRSEFSYHFNDRTAITSSTKVTKGFRGRGVYHALAARLVEMNPQLKSIAVDLVEDNLLAYLNARYSLAGAVTPEEAVKATAFYKVYSRLGFTEIRSVREQLSDQEYVYVVLGRP